MTTINGMTINYVTVFNEKGYSITLAGYVNTQTAFREIREMCALCDSTSVQFIPGVRPFGWDSTPDKVNTLYIVFTTGLKARSGYYQVDSFNSFEDESTKGLYYYFEMGLTFLGTLSQLQAGYEALDLVKLTNDWNT